MPLLSAVEDAQRLLWAARRKPLEAFMLPACVLDGGVLLGRDASLCTLFRIDGARAMTGAAELDRFVELGARALTSRFLERGHALHVVLERAPDEAGLAVSFAGDRLRRQASRLGLDLDDLIVERNRRLAPLLAAETALAACWTRPSALAPAQQKRERRRAALRLKDWLPGLSESQCPAAGWDGLAPRHDALCDAFAALFGDAGIAAERLDGDAAVRALRVLLNGPDSTAPDWRPATPADAGAGYPPPLAPQLLVRDPVRAGPALRIGTRLYAPLDMTLGPRRPRPFSELMDRAAEAGLPFRFSVLIEGGGLAGLRPAAARIASSFLAFGSDDSAAVRNAMTGLHVLRADASAIVRLRLGLLTWTAGDAEVLQRRAARLQQIAEGWGETSFSPLVGDPLEAFAGSVPGFACGATAPAAAAPLAEALRLLPAGRPAPPARLEAANHLFRSPDGKLLPFSYEDGEDYGFDLIYGIPGRGKSVLMNSLTLAHALQSGHDHMPLAAVVDIGPSSAGLISLLREALPPDRRHEAGWFSLRMSRDCAINPFDTQLGCRYPLPSERAFLADLLAIVLAPPGGAVPDGMRELIGPTIARAYALRADGVPGAEPHAWAAGLDPEVDAALELHACHLPANPLWWDAVDALIRAGGFDAALRAQRHAVPVVADLLAAVRHPAVQGLVADARHGAGGETVTAAFSRIVTALVGDWPVMCNPTAFDAGQARVAAVDLREVAPRGSPEADRQTAAMYLLARHALTRGWWLDEESLEEIPERYRAFHAERLRDLRETPKRLAYDEFHRTAASAAVRAQVERDVREARKLRVRLCLASQRIEDFGEALVELATRFWILGAGGKRREIEALSKVFDLNETAADAVSFLLTGPGRDGAPALLVSADPRAERIVVNTPGPVELWALTTSPRDAALRDRLYRRMPPAQARAALARRFPEGTARDAVDAELRRGGRDAETAVLDRLADELAAHAAVHPAPHGAATAPQGPGDRPCSTSTKSC